MMINETLEKVVAGQPVDRIEAQRAMSSIMGGECTPAQIGAFLVALRMRGETVDQISGFAEAMRNACVRIRTKHPNVVDTCGTGGDALETFNISTAAALVTAAAGVPVAKHGNRSVSSKCGSADVLGELGVRIDLEPFEVETCLDELNIGFLFAPSHHPAMKYAIGPRRELGMRTVFNVLGPLTNPAGAPCQLIGVFAPELTETIAQVMRKLGSRRVLVVHGLDGMDEITLTGPTRCSELKDGRIRTYDIDPLAYFPDTCTPEALAGGDPAENAAITRGILTGRIRGPRRDIVLINAAASLMAANRAPDLATGIAQAADAIDSGAALDKLERLVAWTRQ